MPFCYRPHYWKWRNPERLDTVFDRFNCSCRTQTMQYPRGGAKVVQGSFVLGVSLASDWPLWRAYAREKERRERLATQDS